MLHPLRQVGALMDDVCLGKAGFDIADVSVQLRGDVALRIGDPRGSGLVVNDRSAGPHGFLRIEYSYSTWTRSRATSATASLSAMTAATRWPAKRITRSSTSVSSGS
jgi:hypothetical protein